jgi:transcriptional repressor NrdR
MGEKPVIVKKSDGSSEAFNRDKLMRGLLIACAKRSVPMSRLEELITDIESTIRAGHGGEVASKELGEMVLERLYNIDDVAYIRFASVYKDFKSVEEFARALDDIQ